MFCVGLLRSINFPNKDESKISREKERRNIFFERSLNATGKKIDNDDDDDYAIIEAAKRNNIRIYDSSVLDIHLAVERERSHRIALSLFVIKISIAGASADTKERSVASLCYGEI